jgi:hypothetical protein
MSSGQLSFWANVFLGNRFSGKTSFWVNVNVFWANVFLVKCPFRQMPSGQMSSGANVFLGKYLYGKISFWENVDWANVLLGQRYVGKCILANVSGQMSLGKRRMGKRHRTVVYINGWFGFTYSVVCFKSLQMRTFHRFLCYIIFL